MIAHRFNGGSAFCLSGIALYHSDTMEPSEVIGKAAQILDEERIRPTVSYEVAGLSSGDIGTMLTAFRVSQDLLTERQQRPRSVHEAPNTFRFRSTNFELLLALFYQTAVTDRAALIASLLTRISDPASVSRARTARPLPSWNNFVSELPLVAEFCIRMGYKAELLRAIGESKLTQGLVVLLLQLEDTIALNFNLFTDDELAQLATTLSHLRAIAHRKGRQFTRPRGTFTGASKERNPDYDSLVAPIALEIVTPSDGIIEECRQARYWYLKGALQQNANLEINQDKTKVEDYLKRLGFSGPLSQALNVAEQDFRASATPFELKNCLAHLRSFLEELHEQACSPVAAKAGTTAPKKWGKTTEMLRNTEVLSVQEERFAASLYTLISDEGVHPLIAEQEYARLLRNMVIEYGLMFLAKLEKAGIDLH
jgi:hypothetical protein